jgi:ABC-2 type transport system permease protein
MNTSRVIAAYASDIRFEFRKMIRTPAFALPTLLFPAMFYLLFGVLMAKADVSTGLQTFARLGVFGTMAPGLFGFGVSLAFEREYGTLIYRQALPMPPGSYLLARMSMSMLFASIISTMLIVLATTAGHTPLGASQMVRVFLVEVLGVLPFCAIGLMVGSFASGQAAPAVVNLIYLPLAFLSGLWIPLQFLPKFLQDLAPLWPPYHLSQLAFAALDLDSFGTATNHMAALAGITILSFTLAMRRLGNRGLRILGGNGRPGVAFPLRRATAVAVTWISIGLVVAGVMGGRAKVVAAPARSAEAAGSAATDPAASGGPAGVAAPQDPRIADFDAGSDRARYGGGWNAIDDQGRGGNSSVTQRVVAGGAHGSAGALEVSGTVGDAISYPFVGTGFVPVGPEPGKIMDSRGRAELRFYARGDGRQYTVVFNGGVGGGIPPMYAFTSAADWQEVRVPLAEVMGLDASRIHSIAIGALGGEPGDFRFALDDIELR